MSRSQSTANRRRFLKMSALATAALTVPLPRLNAEDGEAPAPKNFVVIFADDFGYGDLGCYRDLFQGGDDLSLAHEYTPNLDRLGRNGVRFMQAYTCAWCAPARQNLLSGRWCNRADVVDRPWVGKQLRDLGYTTCFVGKSHGTSSKAMDMDPATADFNDGLIFNGGMRNFYMRNGEELPRRIDFGSRPFVAKGGEYITDLFTDFGVDFIKRSAKGEKPFFLYLAYTATHSPVDGKLEDLQKMFPGDFDGIEEADWRELLNAAQSRNFEPMVPEKLTNLRKPAPGWSKDTSPAYAKMKKLGRERFVKYNFAGLAYAMDRGVGKIMQTLKEAGVEDDTLVIFTSDNGSVSGSNYPLYSYKQSNFEGGVRVPMIFWSKPIAESEQSGRIVEEITPTTDITPTLVGIAEKKDKPDFPFDGINLWPYLAKNIPVPDDQVFFYAYRSQIYMAAGLFRAMADAWLGTDRNVYEGMKFGGLDYSAREPIFNAVFTKGKDKILYWSTLDGKGRGAVYKELPTDARFSEHPQAMFKEEVVIDGKLPQSGRGKEMLEELAEYVQDSGADELMHTAVFSDKGKEGKPAREFVDIAQE